jgi:hypothetical protein
MESAQAHDDATRVFTSDDREWIPIPLVPTFDMAFFKQLEAVTTPEQVEELVAAQVQAAQGDGAG